MPFPAFRNETNVKIFEEKGKPKHSECAVVFIETPTRFDTGYSDDDLPEKHL